MVSSGIGHIEAFLFEREAYIHEEDMSYLKTRKPLAWLNFINI